MPESQGQAREFKGIWIPAQVYLHPELSHLEKFLLSEIDSFSSGEQGCFAGNEYFASFLGVSVILVSNMISHLKKLELVEQVSFDGRRRILRSCPENYFKADLKKTLRQTTSKLEGRVKENFNHINTENNTLNDSKVTPAGNFPETAPLQPESGGKTKFSLSSVDRRAPAAPKQLGDEYLDVLEAFKKGVFSNCSRKTDSVRDGIPSAVKTFEEYYPGQGKAKLIEALNILFTSKLYQWMQDNNPMMLSPKTIFSKKFVEDKLMPLLNNPSEYAGKLGGMVQHSKTEEELRTVQAVGRKNIRAALEEIDARRDA